MKITINSLLEELQRNHSSVPQPDGKEVALAYEDKRLEDHSTCLHVIALMLRKLRDMQANLDAIESIQLVDFGGQSQ